MYHARGSGGCYGLPKGGETAHYISGSSLVSVEEYRLPAVAPVKSLGAGEKIISSGGMRSSAGYRYRVGISGLHIPALYRDHTVVLQELSTTL